MASLVDVGIALKRLRKAAPPPSGIKLDTDEQGLEAAAVYTESLGKFRVEEIDEGVRRFLAAELDPKLKISLKHFPRPPELAAIVGQVHAERVADADKQRRADALAAERREQDESDKLRIKTPEQKARAAELMARFRAGVSIGGAHQTRTAIQTQGLFAAHDRDAEKRRRAEAEREMWERTNERCRPEKPLVSAEALASCQPVTPEAVAALPDRPVADQFKQVGDAAPGVPAPAAPPALDPVEALAFEDIGEFLKANT